MELNNVIIKPHHTEKSYGLRKFQDPSCLCFIVNRKATKPLIKSAFMEIYNVAPEKINIVVRKPKKLRYTTKGPGYSKEIKFAYITLPKGVQIALTKDEIEEANANNAQDVSVETKDVTNKPKKAASKTKKTADKE